MSQLILTLNAGTSSVKFAAFAHEAAGLEVLASGQIEGLGAEATFLAETASGAKSDYAFDESRGRVNHRAAMAAIMSWLGQAALARDVVAVGHRIVHGGPDFVEPVTIDEAILEKLRRYIPLAPLHAPHNLAGIEAALEVFPKAREVACFDTGFHRSHPFVADTFALPRSYYDEGVRRYGFHGLSYEFIARRLRAIAPAARRGAGDCRPSGQRRFDVRDAQWPLGLIDHGVHPARRFADGHALRPDRSRRHLLLDD